MEEEARAEAEKSKAEQTLAASENPQVGEQPKAGVQVEAAEQFTPDESAKVEEKLEYEAVAPEQVIEIPKEIATSEANADSPPDPNAEPNAALEVKVDDVEIASPEESTHIAEQLAEAVTDDAIETPYTPTPENQAASETASAADPPAPARDLLALVLKSKGYINGQAVLGHPTPSADDKWEISYTFEALSDERARRVHQMSLDRRRKALDDEFRELQFENSGTPTKAKEWGRGFILHLKELSDRGRNWREDFEKTFGGMEKIVWREGKPPSKHGIMAWREQQGSQKKE